MCTIQIGTKRHFRFCIPAGCYVDYDEMEELARDNGVTEPQWLALLDEIEHAMETMQ